MMMLSLFQWLVDTIGKLGPLCVAIAVYIANKRQNKWASSAVVRTANLEDQKMRLALLDKRWAVIRHLRKAHETLLPVMKDGETFVAVLDALREAALVFEDGDRKAIKNCLDAVIGYQGSYGLHFTDLAGADLQQGMIAYEACKAAIGLVINRLCDAARVTALEPLAPPA